MPRQPRKYSFVDGGVLPPDQMSRMRANLASKSHFKPATRIPFQVAIVARGDIYKGLFYGRGGLVFLGRNGECVVATDQQKAANEPARSVFAEQVRLTIGLNLPSEQTTSFGPELTDELLIIIAQWVRDELPWVKPSQWLKWMRWALGF